MLMEAVTLFVSMATGASSALPRPAALVPGARPAASVSDNAAVAAEPQDASGAGGGQTTADKPPKDGKKAKDPGKPKKTKAEKAAAKAGKLAPDEVVDPDAPVIEDTTKGGIRTEWKQHPTIYFGSVLKLEGEAKLQEDGNSSYAGSDLSAQLDPWQLHRNRFGVKGKLFKKIEFEVEREFTEKELTEKDVLLGLTLATPWKDVYVNLAHNRKAEIQIGRFKIPFGLDQLTGVTHNDFIYRSLGASYLTPARDTGVMVHGRFFKRRLNYAVGGFQHDGDNAQSKKIAGGDATFAGRLTDKPFRGRALGGIEFGTAYTISKLSDDSYRPNGLRGRTVLTQDTVYESVYVKGHRRRWEGDVDWTEGRASFRSEYTRVADDRLGQGISGQDLPDARSQAWYVSGTWTVTGERKERPLKPDADFITGGGIGAIELAGRYERLWYDSVGAASLADASRTPRTEVITPEGLHVLTVGVSWTLNRFVKLQVNGIREHVDDASRDPVPNGAAFWSRVFRVQIVL